MSPAAMETTESDERSRATIVGVSRSCKSPSPVPMMPSFSNKIGQNMQTTEAKKNTVVVSEGVGPATGIERVAVISSSGNSNNGKSRERPTNTVRGRSCDLPGDVFVDSQLPVVIVLNERESSEIWSG